MAASKVSTENKIGFLIENHLYFYDTVINQIFIVGLVKTEYHWIQHKNNNFHFSYKRIC